MKTIKENYKSPCLESNSSLEAISCLCASDDWSVTAGDPGSDEQLIIF